MEMNNLFIVATKNKYRFPFKGVATVEDLWDMSLNDLDSIYKTLKRKMKKNEEESLLNEVSAEDSVVVNQIEIIKYIVKVKQAEIENKLREHDKAVRNQKIRSILAQKEDEDLYGKSKEELLAMLNED